MKTAMQCGFSLTQIGEFAFIIASLGVSLHVTSDFLYPIVVAVSVITTFLTPYMIRLAEPASTFVDAHLPESWRKFLMRYSSGSQTALNHENLWKKLLIAMVRITVVYSIVSISIIALSFRFVVPFFKENLPHFWASLLGAVFVILCIAPFLRAIMVKKNHSVEFVTLWHDSRTNRAPLVSTIVIRIMIAALFVIFVISGLFKASIGLIIGVAVLVVLLMVWSRRLKKQSILIERRFFQNLRSRDVRAEYLGEKKPEYAGRFITQVIELGIKYKLHTMVMDISADKVITAMNREDGMFQIQAKAVILAMGCRERSRGALNIPGYRPAGIFSAGTAQRLVNIEGYLPGRKVVILGSGDIGLIMARRMTLEGAEVQVVAELMPYSGGLKRNIVQCLDDFGISLKLSHTVIDIKGKERVEGITLAEVDKSGKPIPGTEEEYECDTLLLSVGLIPENEISRGMGVELNPVTSGPRVNESLETNMEGVFACGNVLHVHDLVDFVSEEAAAAGQNASMYVRRKENAGESYKDAREILLVPEAGVRYTVPSVIRIEHMAKELTVRFRVGGVYKNCYISCYLGKERIIHRKRPVVAPGEMEQIKLTKEQLLGYPYADKITLKIEEA